SWALAGVGARGPVAHLRLARPGRAWVRPDGAVAYLDGAEAAAILASQSREVRAVASGALRAELLRELAAIVAGERRSSAGLSSPGGARPVRWLSVTRAGGTATVDGYVATWVEQTSVRRLPGPGERHVASESVSYAEVEALASLASSGGTWRVVSLAEKPYQQAT
ncbi:MAG: hypothetical protein M0Z33_12425, partial [Actinomycetota bacterium]|nr:hypothetical protein [Actinomycetota bacterium]